MSHKHKNFVEGGLWDNKEWNICFDVSISRDNHCRHCRENDDPADKYEEFICPRVIVAYNEGGCASTGVCLDCVLEAVTQMDGET